MSGPAVNTLLLRTVVPSASSADVPVTVILPKALSMTLVTRTWRKEYIYDIKYKKNYWGGGGGEGRDGMPNANWPKTEDKKPGYKSQ